MTQKKYMSWPGYIPYRFTYVQVIYLQRLPGRGQETKLYYKSNNPATSPPFNLLNVQPDRRGGEEKPPHPEASWARVQFLTPHNPFSNPLTPCRFPRRQPGPSPAQLLPAGPGAPLPAWRSPLPPYGSDPRHAPQVSPKQHHLAPPAPQLAPLSPLSQGCCWKHFSAAAATWTHLFFPRAVSVLMQKATRNPPKRLHLQNLHAKDFRAKEHEIPGGKKTLKNKKSFSSVHVNYF